MGQSEKEKYFESISSLRAYEGRRYKHKHKRMPNTPLKYQTFPRDLITETLLMSQKICFLYFAQMGHSVEKQVIKESKYRYRAEYLDHIDFP